MDMFLKHFDEEDNYLELQPFLTINGASRIDFREATLGGKWAMFELEESDLMQLKYWCETQLSLIMNKGSVETEPK